MQLRALKRLKEFRKPGTQEDVQLKILYFVIIIYTKFIKKLSIIQAISYRS